MIKTQWLTVKQVAASLQLEDQTIRRWLRAGEMNGVFLSDKAGWRIRPEDLDAFLRSKGWEPQDMGKAAA